MAASDANIAHTKSKMAIQTIGYDKLNMMRHVKFFGSVDGLMNHMKKHADIINQNSKQSFRPSSVCLLRMEWQAGQSRQADTS